jgi:hypothetical protein
VSPKQWLLAVVWTALWSPLVFFATAFSMLGDPVEGGADQQRLLGWTVCLAGLAILLIGYGLIVRMRSR